MNLALSSEYKTRAAHLHLPVALFCLRNFLGLIIVLCTKAVGFISLYSGTIIDFLTMFNMKSYRSPCSGAICHKYLSKWLCGDVRKKSLCHHCSTTSPMLFEKR